MESRACNIDTRKIRKLRKGTKSCSWASPVLGRTKIGVRLKIDLDGPQANFVPGVYVVRPYNIFVKPITDGRLDVERIFSFQSGGIWLKKNIFVWKF